MLAEFFKRRTYLHYSDAGIRESGGSSLRIIRLVGRSIDLIRGDLIRLMAVMFHLSASTAVD